MSLLPSQSISMDINIYDTTCFTITYWTKQSNTFGLKVDFTDRLYVLGQETDDFFSVYSPSHQLMVQISDTYTNYLDVWNMCAIIMCNDYTGFAVAVVSNSLSDASNN